MERILLVEPNYKNKYPPIGLMKISTYYKNKGDFVEFHKGLLSCDDTEKFDKVLITTLFTFDFEICIKTIKYYIAIKGIENVFVGGIAATIMPEKFLIEIPGLNLNTGQLTNSKILGYQDDVNIDILDLDYDILWDIPYEYPAADSYFIYTTRGCPRKCKFCAVKTLEPNFYDCNNLLNQIQSVDENFGVKKNLLVMDNNILYSEKFNSTVDLLVKMGFGKNNNSVQKNTSMKFYLKSLEKRIAIGKQYKNLITRIKKEISDISIKRVSKENLEILNFCFEILKNKNNEKTKKQMDDELIEFLFVNKEFIEEFFEKHHYHKIKRYIDFNQGLDARLFSEEKARKMSELSLKPCRIAFDNLNTQKFYLDAMNRAVENGIKYFSNYLLYNFEDEPEDLWERLSLNIKFCHEHKKEKIFLFSFPMKYASIEHTDRSYVGINWNRKYLRAINVILNVTSGVVAKEEDFFLRAYGASSSEFLEILAMPDDFIRYRDYFEKNGYMKLWKNCYRKLSSDERKQLILILSELVECPSLLENDYKSESINNILSFYKIKKNNVENYDLFFIEHEDNKKRICVI